MVLGSPLSGATTTANGTAGMSQQGSRLSQMQDSFRKQMLRDKERAKVSPTAPRTSPATTRSAESTTTPTRQVNSAPKSPAKQTEEERRPLRQTQRRDLTSAAATPPPSSTPRQRQVQDENSTVKKVTSPVKSPSSSNAARQKSSTKSSTTTVVSHSPSQSSRASTGMRRGPPPGSAAQPATDLPTCRNCGRHFAADRLAKHEEICIKTSKKKRKVFDPTKMRVKGTEAESYLRNAAKTKAKAPELPKADWRRQHEDFIRSIRDAKAAQAHVAAGGKLSDLPPPPPMDTSHLIPCPHCGRKFNDSAAQRHIPRCKDIINKPKPPPGARPSAAVGRAAPKPAPTRR